MKVVFQFLTHTRDTKPKLLSSELKHGGRTDVIHTPRTKEKAQAKNRQSIPLDQFSRVTDIFVSYEYNSNLRNGQFLPKDVST
jgi:hypothetical protein